MKRLLVALVAGMLVAGLSRGQSVKPVSVEVMATLGKEDEKLFYMNSGGTAIRAIVSLADKFMLAVDEEGSKPSSFTDDLGNDLTKPKDQPTYRRGWIESYTFKTNEKGDRGGVRFIASGTPAAGAKSITLKGTMRVLCGVDEKTFEKKEFDIKIDPKSKYRFEDFTLTVQSGFSGGPMLSFESNLPNLRKVEFFDAAGNPLATNPPSRGKMGFNKKYTYTTSYNLKEAAKTIAIKVTYFGKIELVDVPVDLTVSVGF